MRELIATVCDGRTASMMASSELTKRREVMIAFRARLLPEVMLKVVEALEASQDINRKFGWPCHQTDVALDLLNGENEEGRK
jgi:ferric iron reductase protein FhuF